MAVVRHGAMDFDQQWDIQGVLDFISRRKSKTIAVQFPDDLLGQAVEVVQHLQQQCIARQLKATVYLLGDTSYNSLGVDEVAAAHINADAMVHYGRASFSLLSRLPTFYVLGQAKLDISDCAKKVAGYAAAPLNPEGKNRLLVFLDQPLLWALPALQKAMQLEMDSFQQQGNPVLAVSFADIHGREREPLRTTERSHAIRNGTEDTKNGVMILSGPADPVCEGPCSHSIGGYSWIIPADTSLQECIWLWVGKGGTQAQLQLQMTYHDQEWAMLEPDEGRWQDGIPLEITRTLKRRYYLVEKAKNAQIVGILVGTLGAAGYKDAISRIRALAHAAGKKTYTLLMGKPNPAKLANFPEVEIFVHVADPQGHIFDSKEYYAPIITPYEAQLAFTPGAEWGKEYRLDFETLLHGLSYQALDQSEPRFSLVDSTYHGDKAEAMTDSSSALSTRPVQDLSHIDEGQKHLMQVESAAGYLRLRRSFQGLEAPVVGSAVKEAEKAEVGRSGRAAQYQDEPDK